jgi:hypothetical protein
MLRPALIQPKNHRSVSASVGVAVGSQVSLCSSEGIFDGRVSNVSVTKKQANARCLDGAES